MNIGIFGIGKSNLGVLKYIRSRYSDVKLTLRSDVPLSDSVISSLSPERVFIGERAILSISEDVLFLSPTVRRDRPEIAAAEARGVKLSSDAELFFENYSGKRFCVTGSDGKSTCTYLVASMLSYSGCNSTPAGNYGKSLAELLLADTVPIAELSSFQLMYTAPTSDSALITNITPNHLNWHSDIDEYMMAKRNLALNAKRITTDADSPLSLMALSQLPLFCVVSSVYSYHELICRVKSENYITKKGTVIYLNGEPYFNLDRVQRKEDYNVKNYMLASGMLLDFCPPDSIRQAINAFNGLPHRAELVADSDGIRYLNSSIDSTPDRTLQTLSSLSGSTAVIICGLGKKLSLDMLAEKLPLLTCGAVLMGELGREVGDILSKSNVQYAFTYAESMDEAIKKAQKLVTGGGNIILSPAGTSFDKYKNFEERGEDFKNRVLKLTQKI